MERIQFSKGEAKHKLIVGLSIVLLCARCNRVQQRFQKTTALSVCKQLESAGIGKDYVEKNRRDFSAAVEKYDITLPNGEFCQVLRYEKAEHVTKNMDMRVDLALIVRPHWFGNAKAKILVQCNEGMSLEDGKKTGDIVEGL